MNRRQFIKTSAFTGTSLTLASCGNPEYHLIRFIPEERLIRGIAVMKPSVCPLCSAGCGLTVRVMEGDAEVIRNNQHGVTKMGLAKKIDGNPAHPISQGKICPRGQAAVQITYHPDRINRPLKRSGARFTGGFQEITWEAAMSELIAKLDALGTANDQKSLGFLGRPQRGMRSDLIAEFAKRFGAPAPIWYEFFSEQVLRRANGLSFGKEQLPTIDLAESRYVMAFGADFLGTWNSPVSQNVGYGTMRQGRPGIRGKFVQFEARMSQTGANADEWVPMKPGMDGVMALGLAHVIMKSGLRKAGDAGQAGTLIEDWSGGLANYSPEEVAKKTGVAAERIERLAREFSQQTPAVAIIGGSPLAQSNGLFSAVAVNALNALVGSVGKPGGIFFTPQSPIAPAGAMQNAAIDKVAASLLAGDRPPIQLLLVDGADPVFASPRAWKVREALMKIPFIVSFGNFLDDTSTLSDLVLPDHSFLESWVTGTPESGSKVAVTNVAPPALRPLHDTRAMTDVLLEVSTKLSKPLNPPLTGKTFEEMLRAAFGDSWPMAQRQGGVWEETAAAASAAAPAVKPGVAVKFADPQFDGDAAQYPFHFLPYASQQFLDGSLAHLPWLQEMPDVLSTGIWNSWVELNPQTAAKIQVSQGDLVEITSSQGALRVPAVIHPGLAPDVIAMPVGQGHETFTRYASGRGENPISILAPVMEAETGALAWAATRVQVARAGNADGRLTIVAGSLTEYPPDRMHR